jgi:hypothetical protein|tara:strand:- start:470 stop:619 length:150 start_codon:yes stop_codon:yes gene_type:complete
VLPLGDAHFKDFLSRVKRLGEKKQYFFILVKIHTALLKKTTPEPHYLEP